MNALQSRSGTTLLELMVAATLFTLLGTALCGVLLVQLRLATRMTDRAQTAEAIRIATAVSQGEVRRIQSSDVRAASADSLAIRAFRGAAVPCAYAESVVHVRYRGERLPEPAKDSVLPVTAAPTATALGLVDARASTHADCQALPGERVLQLRLAQPADTAALLLIFESGSYYLSSRALRYRLGAEGRQPLTAELLLPGSRFSLANDRVAITLVTLDRDTTLLVARMIAWPAAAVPPHPAP